MTDAQLAAAPGKILHLPTVLGAVVPVYNIPGLSQELKFTGTLLADITLAKITKWNDPAIAKLNPGVNLPATDIVVANRSDGSGTTYIWVDYLSKISPEFNKTVGVNTSVKWPTGIGGKGNEGVAGLVSQTPGAIGVGLSTLQNKIAYGSAEQLTGPSCAHRSTLNAAAAKSMLDALPRCPAPRRILSIASFTWLLFTIKDRSRPERWWTS